MIGVGVGVSVASSNVRVLPNFSKDTNIDAAIETLTKKLSEDGCPRWAIETIQAHAREALTVRQMPARFNSQFEKCNDAYISLLEKAIDRIKKSMH